MNQNRNCLYIFFFFLIVGLLVCCLLFVLPDILVVQLNHHIKRLFSSSWMRVREHRVHEVLKSLVDFVVFMSFVNDFDIRNNVSVKELSQRLVTASEEFEEQLKQSVREGWGKKKWNRIQTISMLFKK